MRAAVERNSAPELGVASSTGPSQNTGDDPDEEGGARRANVRVDLARGGEDSRSNHQSNDERESIEVSECFVFFKVSAVQ